MTVEAELKLKLTSNELCVLTDCQELLTEIATRADELGGEFSEVQLGSIDDTISTLMTLRDISEPCY